MAGELEDDISTGCVSIDLKRLRSRVRSYIEEHHYDSAMFWADKLVSFSKGATEDVYWYAQSLFLTRQFHRASHLIRSRKIDKTSVSCRYLAAKCHELHVPTVHEYGDDTQDTGSAMIEVLSHQRGARVVGVIMLVLYCILSVLAVVASCWGPVGSVHQSVTDDQSPVDFICMHHLIFDEMVITQGHSVRRHEWNLAMFKLCHSLFSKYECGEFQEALDILDMVEHQNIPENFPPTLNLMDSYTEPARTSITDSSSCCKEKTVQYSINLLRGKIYEAMDNRGLAAECFREALQSNVYCFEAFDLLVNHHMLTAEEERDLLNSLQFNNQCPETEVELVRFLYENKLKKYDKPADLKVPTAFKPLEENIDVMVYIAERKYYNCEFRDSYQMTKTILEKDPYNSQCLPLQIAVLSELKKTHELFYLAHKLVDLYPQKPVAWFAVGCYYLLTKNSEPARRYLSKATTLDRLYGPAWLAYGHSFSMFSDHDQAMAAYFTASQTMKGCHLPMLYIGLEYGLTSNSKLAERFFKLALTLAPEDPFVLHEMGVIAYQNSDWGLAEKYFLNALDKVQNVSQQLLVEKWEPLLNNLGHTCRKLRKYEDALDYHTSALTLSPQNPSTFSAIGFIYTFLGENLKAVDYFHKALGIRRDDTFSNTMLGKVLEALIMDMEPCEDLPDPLPKFQCSTKLEISDEKDEELKNSIMTEGKDYYDAKDSLMTDADGSSMAIDEVDMEASD